MKTFILLTTLFFSSHTFAWSEGEEESLQQLQQVARDTAIINQMRSQERQQEYNAYQADLNAQQQMRQERFNTFSTNMILLDGQDRQ